MTATIQDVINSLTGREGIMGCMLVNPSGSPVYSTLPPEVDSARLAGITSTLYSNNDVSIQRMNRGSLTQMTLLTDAGILHFYRINSYLLIVFTDTRKVNLEGLLKVVLQESAQLAPLLSTT